MTLAWSLDPGPRLDLVLGLRGTASWAWLLCAEVSLLVLSALACVAAAVALALFASLRRISQAGVHDDDGSSKRGGAGRGAEEGAGGAWDGASVALACAPLPAGSSPVFKRDQGLLSLASCLVADYGHLGAVVHADHAGAPPPPARLVRAAADALLGPDVPLGNPHSAGAWGDVRWGARRASHGPATALRGARNALSTVGPASHLSSSTAVSVRECQRQDRGGDAAAAAGPTSAAAVAAASPLPLTADSLRALLARHLGVSLDDFAVVFTSGASDALRLVAEAFPWSAPDHRRGQDAPDAPRSSRFAHLSDAHSSVLAIRQTALRRGAAVACYGLDASDGVRLRMRSDGWARESRGAIERGPSPPPTSATSATPVYSLLAYPAESNVCGRRLPAEVAPLLVRTLRAEATPSAGAGGPHAKAPSPPGSIGLALEAPLEPPAASDVNGASERWLVLVDAAKAAANPDARAWLDLSRADLAALSLYKLFGFPTGLGALLVRRSTALPLLRPAFVGGGATRYVMPWSPEVEPLDGPDGFVSGTPNFQAVPAAVLGFAWLERLAHAFAREQERTREGAPPKRRGREHVLAPGGPRPPRGPWGAPDARVDHLGDLGGLDDAARSLVLLARRFESMADAFAHGLAALRHAGDPARPLARLLGARAAGESPVAAWASACVGESPVAAWASACAGEPASAALGPGDGGSPASLPPPVRSSTVAFVLFSPDGSPVPSGDVARQLALRGVLVRAGLLCNPGGVAEALGVGERELALRRDPASTSCAGDADVVDGKHVTLVRVSFGLASRDGDPQKILAALADQYLFSERTGERLDAPAAGAAERGEEASRDRSTATLVGSNAKRAEKGDTAPVDAPPPDDALLDARPPPLEGACAVPSPSGLSVTSLLASESASPPVPAGPSTPLRSSPLRVDAESSEEGGEGGGVLPQRDEAHLAPDERAERWRNESDASSRARKGRSGARASAAESKADSPAPLAAPPPCPSSPLWWTSSSSPPGQYRVRSVFVFPLKGARGFSPLAWPLGPQGLAHDRHWAVRELGLSRALTPKSCPALGALQASVDPPAPQGWQSPIGGAWPAGGQLRLELELTSPDAGGEVGEGVVDPSPSGGVGGHASPRADRLLRTVSLSLDPTGELSEATQARADAWLSETLGRPVQLVPASSLKGKKAGGAGSKRPGTGPTAPTTAPKASSPPSERNAIGENGRTAASTAAFHPASAPPDAPTPASALTSLVPPTERLPLRISTSGGVLALTTADLVELHAALERPLEEEEQEVEENAGMRGLSAAVPSMRVGRVPVAAPPEPTSRTLEELALRFRPNLLLACSPSERAFASDEWQGLVLASGPQSASPLARPVEPSTAAPPPALVALGSCPRCDRVCYDPSTGRRADAEPLLTLSRLRRGHGRVCFGALLDTNAEGLTERGEVAEHPASLGPGWRIAEVGQSLQAAWRTA